MTDEAAWVGNPENFSPSHVESLLSKGLVGSAVNLEKAIFSLEYVAQLKNAGLDFIFKGGSAVQILLGDRWNRLSIDVDVCTDASKGELIEALGAIGKRFGGRGFSYEAREGENLGRGPLPLLQGDDAAHHLQRQGDTPGRDGLEAQLRNTDGPAQVLLL